MTATSDRARLFLPPEPQARSVVVEPAVTKRSEGLRICLTGEIGTEAPISLAAVKKKLLLQRDAPKTIVINSSGGNVTEAYRIYNFLRAMPVPLATVADKMCRSAALIVFLAADFRIAMPRAEFLLHQAHMSADDLPRRLNSRALRRYADDMKSADDRILDLLESRTGYRRRYFEGEMGDECIMSEAFVIESGLVHEWPGLNRCISTWSDDVRAIQSAKMILPQYLTSANYLAACRASAHFPPVVD